MRCIKFFFVNLLVIFFLVYSGCASSKKSLPDNRYVLNFSEEDSKILAEGMPYPIGGIEAIRSRIRYPVTEKIDGVEGTVYVIAYINNHGEVDEVKIVKGVSPGLDKAAMDAVKATKFIPGRENGVPVKVSLTIPITFRLYRRSP